MRKNERTTRNASAVSRAAVLTGTMSVVLSAAAGALSPVGLLAAANAASAFHILHAVKSGRR